MMRMDAKVNVQMTVKELIEILSKYDENEIVSLISETDYYGDSYWAALGIENENDYIMEIL